MPYEYFDHQADVGIVGIGKTLEEAFEQGAVAMFKVMSELESIKPSKSVSIEATGTDDASLFAAWLNELLAQKEIKDMFFSKFKVEKIANNKLKGKAYGEKLNLKKHHLKTEVKAATYSQLKVIKEKGLYKAQCVVDV